MSLSSFRCAGFLSCAAVALVISGCGAASPDESTGQAAEDLHGGGHHGRRHLVAPGGVYFADVQANGTGCPDGTWDVAISSDGQTFTATFSAFEAQIAAGDRVASKDCQLDIQLGSTDGLSYSVASFFYQGYAFLEKPGMRARQTASYFFRNDRENRADVNEIAGPADDSFLFDDEVGPGRRAWSSCRRDEVLHVKTALSLNNDREISGEGYVNTTTVDASLSFNWKLDWRRCHGQ